MVRRLPESSDLQDKAPCIQEATVTRIPGIICLLGSYPSSALVCLSRIG